MKKPQGPSEYLTKDGRAVVIRRLRRGDLDALVRFANAISKEKAADQEFGIVSLDGRVTREEERRFLNRILGSTKKGEVSSRVAVSGGEVVGHADVWRRKPRDVRHTGVFGIVIRDGYRGVGIGGALMKEVLADAKRMGVWLVELDVFATNTRAMRLYEKMGFVRVGTVPDKIVRGRRRFDEVVMYADLRNR